jgi:hypothetical protein
MSCTATARTRQQLNADGDLPSSLVTHPPAINVMQRTCVPLPVVHGRHALLLDCTGHDVKNLAEFNT